MKRVIFLLALAAAVVLPVQAQNQPPFIFTLSGGLFFPSQPEFREVFGTGSDIIWGGGGSVPIGGPFYIMADYTKFRAETFPGPVDTSIVLEERFIHAGILLKERLGALNMLRISGGMSYVTVSRTISGSATPATSVDADKSIGYFGGIGLEQLLDPHVSVFGDILYDYKHSRSRDLAGDFSGTRLAVGVNIILF
jgi:hypothetical protein